MIKTDLKSLFQDEDWLMVYSSWYSAPKNADADVLAPAELSEIALFVKNKSSEESVLLKDNARSLRPSQ